MKASLHPDDRLAEDLRMDELDSLALTAFVLAIEEAYDIDLEDVAMASARPLRDVVLIVERALTHAGTA